MWDDSPPMDRKTSVRDQDDHDNDEPDYYESTVDLRLCFR